MNFEVHKSLPTDKLEMLRKIDNRFDYLLEYFPNFEYSNPKPEYKNRLAITVKDNILGHTQRSFVTYWAMRMFLESGGEPGISMCAGQLRDAFCMSNDLHYTDNHPVYGGVYKPQLHASTDDLPFVGSSTIPWIVSNHGLEHTHDPGKTLREWLRILKPGGIIAFVIPDEKYEWAERDPDHKHKYSAEEVKYQFIDPLTEKEDEPLATGPLCVLHEYDTFQNFFSTNCVIQKL